MKSVCYLIVTLTIITLAGCGGSTGGNGSTYLTATVKLATNGTPSANLAGIGLTVTLPSGVTPALNSDGSVETSVIAVSGVATSGTVLAPVYTAASGSAKGKLQFAMASSTEGGFGAGEFATLTLKVAAGTSITQNDYSLSGFAPVDTGGNAATGLTPTISGVSVR